MKFFTSCAEVMEFANILMPAEMVEVEKLYPVYLNSYYLDLIDWNNWQQDPIALQCLPRSAELADKSSSFDPLAEEEQMPVAKLIHRFRDRVVILVTGKCAMRCRFCFRKREWAAGNDLSDLSDKELDDIISYLAAHREVREILLSGGDAMMLPIARLENILRRLKSVESIEIIRIASRIPVVWPQRITDDIANMLGGFPGVWFATHFNHPRELTCEALAACGKLIRAGVPVINQTVLLKGVNDNADVLETLFRKLVANRIKPHYLFHVDPVRGVRHFATGIECGLNILREFRSRLSSLAVPTFAIDLPEGGGKVALQPEYKLNGLYPDIHGKKWIRYDTHLPAEE
ncbi:MAG: KamA family radical SAM protein [Lentisphaerae bacterium]|nr:KamA family radical SAM protein [Lentisphaerota bacterium]